MNTNVFHKLKQVLERHYFLAEDGISNASFLVGQATPIRCYMSCTFFTLMLCLSKRAAFLMSQWAILQQTVLSNKDFLIV